MPVSTGVKDHPGMPALTADFHTASHIRVEGIERYNNNFTSLYKLLEDEYELKLDGSIDKITVKVADFMESEMLQIPLGSALIVMRRVTYFKGIPMTYDYLRIRADKYQFEIDMQGIDKDF